MSLLLQIEQPRRLPLFVRTLHRDGSLLVTFEHARARRFRRRDSDALSLVQAIASKWSEPGQAHFIPAEGAST